MKKLSWLIGIALVAVIGYVAMGPYLTISAIKTGIAEQNLEQLSENIDFPALRQNLKEQIKATAMKSAATELKDNPLGALAAGLAGTMADGIVDSFVTPAGLASIMEGSRPSASGTVRRGDTRSAKTADLLRNARYSYDSLSTFSIWVANQDGGEVQLVLRRHYLTWRLVNIILPMPQTP